MFIDKRLNTIDVTDEVRKHHCFYCPQSQKLYLFISYAKDTANVDTEGYYKTVYIYIVIDSSGKWSPSRFYEEDTFDAVGINGELYDIDKVTFDSITFE